MNLQSYLNRIHFDGVPRIDVDTLRRIHYQHLLTIPYENLDVQLARKAGIDAEGAYEKIVERGRGGWCYEMNGLLDWALREIGFDVMRMTGGVMREDAGDDMLGNHLVLSVKLNGTIWLVDVGFGDGMVEPVPLVPSEFTQSFMAFQLTQQNDGFWRFHNHPAGSAKSFDFCYAQADENLLAEKCQWLQSAPESGFVQNLVCQRFDSDAIRVLKGRMLINVTANGKTKTLLNSAKELDATLSDAFNITLGDDAINVLWSRAVARHAELFPSE